MGTCQAILVSIRKIDRNPNLPSEYSMPFVFKGGKYENIL